MTRRDLIQKVLIGGTTFIILPNALSSCSKDSSIPGGGGNANKLTLDLSLPAYSALNTVGGFVVVQGIIVANSSIGLFAISSTCTHQGCTIGFNPTANNFPCPCHGSVFSTTGAVINGPATVALKSYSVSKSGNSIIIQL